MASLLPVTQLFGGFVTMIKSGQHRAAPAQQSLEAGVQCSRRHLMTVTKTECSPLSVGFLLTENRRSLISVSTCGTRLANDMIAGVAWWVQLKGVGLGGEGGIEESRSRAGSRDK